MAKKKKTYNETKGNFILTDGTKYFKGSDFFSNPFMTENIKEAFVYKVKWIADNVAKNFKLQIIEL